MPPCSRGRSGSRSLRLCRRATTRGRAAEAAADRTRDRVHPGRNAGLRRADVLDDQVRHRGERKPDPAAEQRGRDVDLGARSRATASSTNDEAAGKRRRAAAAWNRAASRAAQSASRRAASRRRRDEEQAGLGHRGAEAETRSRRSLDELRYQDERRVHAEAEQQRDGVRRPDAANPHHPHVDERMS